jgi:hypothetical protein
MAWMEGDPVIDSYIRDTKISTRKDSISVSLPTDSKARKGVPLVTGLLDYFPDALVEVARVSQAGNDKHNPGQPLHWQRGVSGDHADSCVRHLVDRGGIDPDTGCRHSAEAAWRALANLQQEMEDEGAPMSRGSWAAVDAKAEDGGDWDRRFFAAAKP